MVHIKKKKKSLKNKTKQNKAYITGNSLAGQWLGLGAFTARAQVRSLGGKLHAAKKKKKKRGHSRIHFASLEMLCLESQSHLIPTSPLPQFYAQPHLCCALDYILPLNDRPQFVFPFSV